MTRHDWGGRGVFSYCAITQSPLGKHKSFFGGALVMAHRMPLSRTGSRGEGVNSTRCKTLQIISIL